MALFTRLIVIVALLAALLPTAADARHRHRDRGDGFDLGDAVIGAAVVGGIIAIASAAKRDRDEKRRERERDRRDEWPKGDWGQGGGWYPENAEDPRAGDWNVDDDDYSRGTYAAEGAAVDTCVREAEDLAGRYGADARVVRVGEPRADAGETRVAGLIEITDRREASYGAVSNSEWVCYVRADGDISSFRFLTA